MHSAYVRRSRNAPQARVCVGYVPSTRADVDVSITTAGVGDVGQAALVVWYVAVASALVWAPIVLFVLLGERIVALMTRAQKRVARYQRGAMVYALLLLAPFLIIDAIAVL